MLYAKVVFGLAVRGEFDYSVPEEFAQDLACGFRVLVEFGRQKKIGYVVALSRKTAIARVKPVIKLLDKAPVIRPELLLLAKKISEYYACPLGEAVESVIFPDARRLKRPLPLPAATEKIGAEQVPEKILLHDLDAHLRWDDYAARIIRTLEQKRSAVVVMPDQHRVDAFFSFISEKLKEGVPVIRLSKAAGMAQWLKAMEPVAQVVIAMRSGVFAPCPDPGLIIVDEEDAPVYKQEQTPHYHARTVAIMRSGVQKADLVLGSVAPSLECVNLSKTGFLKYVPLGRKTQYPEVVFMFSGKKMLSSYLESSMQQSLAAGEKILLFINRKGFATFAACNNCSKVIKCERCSTSLVYHYETQVLACHHCNFKMPPPKVCPFCNSGYVVYSGLGTEKVESEVARIFPSARIARIDQRQEIDVNKYDIFVATSLITRGFSGQFDLIGVLGIDSELNRPELSAAEHAYGILAKLAVLTHKRMVIQTNASHNSCFQAVAKNDPALFYDAELAQRKLLHLPPFAHLASILIRGHVQEKAEAAAAKFYEGLKSDPARTVKVLALQRGVPYLLRGNYYWNIIVSARSIIALNDFLKSRLKIFRPSGIIVTVDVDPI